ncbi:Hypothetical_protein [Hexamita inflata]|uniref:Hypothetical_protein n=1 Tax=Hexamita inflata TaxID=28002 RepID=A0ABP1IAI9_9EUKA
MSVRKTETRAGVRAKILVISFQTKTQQWPIILFTRMCAEYESVLSRRSVTTFVNILSNLNLTPILLVPTRFLQLHSLILLVDQKYKQTFEEANQREKLFTRVDYQSRGNILPSNDGILQRACRGTCYGLRYLSVTRVEMGISDDE